MIDELRGFISEYAADMRESREKRRTYESGFVAGQEFACMTILTFMNGECPPKAPATP